MFTATQPGGSPLGLPRRDGRRPGLRDGSVRYDGASVLAEGRAKRAKAEDMAQSGAGGGAETGRARKDFAK